MKSHCLLLVLLCSAFIIQDVNSTTLRRKTSHHLSAKTGGYTPTNNIIQITNYDGIQARDVGVGADGTIWYVSNTKSGNDYTIYRMTPDSNTWELIDGAATYISVANDGNAWIVRADHSVARYTGSEWKSVSGTAYEISCAPDGNVYHVGTSSSIYMLNRAGTSWNQITGITGTRVAGGVAQSAFHVNSARDIYRTIPNAWEKMTGSATDIAVGANGLLWISTTGTKPNQLAVFDEKKQNWINVPLADYLAQSGPISGFTDANIVRVAVAPNGDLIGVKDDFTMFRMRYNWSN